MLKIKGKLHRWFLTSLRLPVWSSDNGILWDGPQSGFFGARSVLRALLYLTTIIVLVISATSISTRRVFTSFVPN